MSEATFETIISICKLLPFGGLKGLCHCQVMIIDALIKGMIVPTHFSCELSHEFETASFSQSK